MPITPRLLAALKWLRAEAGIGAPDSELIRRARKEIKRRRDYQHYVWAKEYLNYKGIEA